MSSLAQLLAAHAPILLIDAASARVQVGWLTGDNATTRWASSNEEAGNGVFQCLSTLEVQPDAAGAFIYCDGPGSILGIRTVAMALRAWAVRAPRPVFRYRSLAVVAHFLNTPELTIIADARRDRWHAFSIGSELRRCAAQEISGPLATPEGFRHWAPLPANVSTVTYSLAEMLPTVAERDLFEPIADPDAFLHEEPSYATWSRQIHRAP